MLNARFMGPPAQLIPQRSNLSRMPYSNAPNGSYGAQPMPIGNMYSQPPSMPSVINGGGDTTLTRSRPLPQQQYPLIQEQQQRQMTQTTTQFIQQQQTNLFQRGTSTMQMGYPLMPTNNSMQQQMLLQQQQQVYQQQLRSNPVGLNFK